MTHGNTKHGHNPLHGKESPTYISWCAMKRRCKRNKWYLERNIKVCDRWLKFTNFLLDMGERPPGRTLDRIDNEGNYEPGNCRWATLTEQNNNKRGVILLEYNGVSQSIAQWARETGMSHHLILQRHNRGMTPAQIFTTPKLK